MSGYSKLFSSIVTSSIWTESNSTLRVWIAMLATCNAEGVVEGAIPGFASLARVTVEEMKEAVKTLSSPDEFSRTPDNEGRRIEVILGGWRILNYERYRNTYQSGRGTSAERTRRYRERKKEPKKETELHKTDACKTSRSVTCDTVSIPTKLAAFDGFELKWAEWIACRKENRHPLNENTQLRQLRFLSRFEPSVAIQVLDTSMTNGWTGLFAPKGNQPKQNQSLDYRP
jgi:hypothetical protein